MNFFYGVKKKPSLKVTSIVSLYLLNDFSRWGGEAVVSPFSEYAIERAKKTKGETLHKKWAERERERERYFLGRFERQGLTTIQGLQMSFSFLPFSLSFFLVLILTHTPTPPPLIGSVLVCKFLILSLYVGRVYFNMYTGVRTKKVRTII